MNTDLSFSVFTANIISLLLLGTLYLSNRQKLRNDKDTKIVLCLMAVTAVSNVADTCLFYLDSSSGVIFEIIIFLSGSWLFLGNVLIGYTWLDFLTTHLNIPLTDRRKLIYNMGGLISAVLLAVNIFYPLVFRDVDGVYQRGPAYSVFLILAFLYIADSLYLYVKCRRKTGTLKLFPVEVFLVPIIIGVVVQALFVEIAITWTSIAIAIAGIMTALKNETIFLDHLTGLHNRVYLDFLQEQACKKKAGKICGIMVDLNGFKEINDGYGHSEGDAALIITADVLKRSFGEYGIVTRFAGDEFVVILNTTDEQLVQRLIQKAKDNFDEQNKMINKPYKLSASMGYAISGLSDQTVESFMNCIDRRMYRDKLKYHNENDGRTK